MGCIFRYNLATASDLRYYALLDAQNRLESLLAKQADKEKSGLGGPDTVTPEQIAEIFARWTSIPVTHLMSTEKEKLLCMGKILLESVVGQPRGCEGSHQHHLLFARQPRQHPEANCKFPHGGSLVKVH